jgi:DNA-binding response OmpR family regulator
MGEYSQQVSRGSILFVDDDADNLQKSSEVLRHAGFTVVCAENGFDALSHLKSRTVDLCIIDYILPDMIGVQLQDVLRRYFDGPNATVPVLFLTGGRIAGADSGHKGTAFLEKPYEEEYLLEKVNALMAPDSFASTQNVLVKPALSRLDFTRIDRIAGGDEAKSRRFLEVYAEQFRELIALVARSHDASMLPELRNSHHKASTALQLLQLYTLDTRLRSFRDVLRRDAEEVTAVKAELLLLLRHIVLELDDLLKVRAAG